MSPLRSPFNEVLAPRVRNHHHVELALAQAATVRLTPSTAIEPLRMKYGASAGWKPDRQPARLAFGPDLFDDANAVDVSKHEMAVESAVAAQRALEIHFLAALQRAERGDARGLGADVREHVLAVDQDRRQADAVDREAVADLHLGRERRVNPHAKPAADRP